jgi:ubiquinone/menaquinone biosynthesis C-methylase UbiE
MKDTVERFSKRVESYAKFRPGYPPEILELLRESCGLSTDSVIADVGSGTGKLAEIFLAHGNLVFGVEPNSPMRQAAEVLFQEQVNFRSINGMAERTSLPINSVDFITAGQAFHWFNRREARVEFARILKPGGWVVIVWNERRLDSTPFLRDYEGLLLKYGTDYKEVRHENVRTEVKSFFAPANVMKRSFENFQEFDFEGLKGRISSTSYTPEPGTEAYLTMLETLREVFESHASEGRVVFEYDTTVYFGRLE